MGRRIPPAVWILAPVALGLLYYALYDRVARAPTLENVVPAEAIQVDRYRNKAALDTALHRNEEPSLPSAQLAENTNLPGLTGVDLARPFHLVRLPPMGPADSRLVIYPVADASALRGKFMDPWFLEHGMQRQPVHLGTRGAFAAVGWDREVVRHLGTGGITAADLGEDHVLAFKVPEMIDVARAFGRLPPWRPILEAFGVDIEGATADVDPATGAPRILVYAGRSEHVRRSWKTGRVWFWDGEKHLRAELEPAEGVLQAELAHVLAAPPTSSEAPAPPARAEAWIRIPGSRERTVTALVLQACGAKVPDSVVERPGGLLLWAEPALDPPAAWTIGLAGAGVDDSVLDAFGLLDSAGLQGVAPIRAGAAPITLPDLSGRTPAPAGEVVKKVANSAPILAIGPGARTAAAGMETRLSMPDPYGDPPPQPPESGLRLLAWFRLSQARALQILGRELEPGGFLMCLAGGDIAGEVYTDGHVVRLDARVVPR